MTADLAAVTDLAHVQRICRNNLSRFKRRDYQRLQCAQHRRNTFCKPLIQRREFVTYGYNIRYSKSIVANATVAKHRREPAVRNNETLRKVVEAVLEGDRQNRNL